MLRELSQNQRWWIRTGDRGLRIGRLLTDSEGTNYFLIVGNNDCFYNIDDVSPNRSDKSTSQ